MSAHEYDPACQCWQCLPRAQRQQPLGPLRANDAIGHGVALSDSIYVVGGYEPGDAAIAQAEIDQDIYGVDSVRVVAKLEALTGDDLIAAAVGVAAPTAERLGEIVEAVAIEDDEPKLSKPPSTCAQLLSFFTAEGINCEAFNASNGPIQRGARGMPDPDRKIISRGSVGFKQRSEAELHDRAFAMLPNGQPKCADKAEPERRSKSQAVSETAAILAKLSAHDVRVLAAVYGSQDARPLLKLGWDPSGAEKPSKETKREGERYELREALGDWRMWLPHTKAAKYAYAAWRAEQREPEQDVADRRVARARKVADEDATLTEFLRLFEEEAREAVAARDAEHETEASYRAARESVDVAGQWIKYATEAIDSFARHKESILGADHDVDLNQTDMSIDRWLAEVVTRKGNHVLLSNIRVEADQDVRRAWNAWLDARGRRAPAVPKGWTFERGEDV